MTYHNSAANGAPYMYGIGVFCSETHREKLGQKNTKNTEAWRKYKERCEMKYPAIKEHHLYNKTYKSGKHFFGRYVCVYVLRDLHAKRLCKEHPQKIYVNRLGLSVTKKVGGAVARSRAKRIIRAGYSCVQKDLRTGFLIVISARPEIVGQKSTAIAKELRYAFSKLDMFKVNETERINIGSAQGTEK